jgi:hypothetical protein
VPFDVEEERVLVGAVVEHAIEHDPEPALVTGLHQPPQHLQIPELRVHRKIILGVVFMVAGTLENGREIQRRDAEIGQVVQAVDDPFQVAAHEIAVGRRAAPRLYAQRIAGGFAPGKPLDENLVEDRVAHPGRGFKEQTLE